MVMDAGTIGILAMTGVGAAGFAIGATRVKETQTKVVLGVFSVVLVMVFAFVAAPFVLPTEQAAAPPAVDGGADWRVDSITVNTGATIRINTDTYKQPMNFNFTGNNFVSQTEYIELNFSISNDGEIDKSGVKFEITSEGIFEDDEAATTTSYFIIKRWDSDFTANWTKDSGSTVRGLDGPVVPTSLDVRDGWATLNLTASATAVDNMDVGDVVPTVITISNSQTGDTIKTVTINWDLTTGSTWP